MKRTIFNCGAYFKEKNNRVTKLLRMEKPYLKHMAGILILSNILIAEEVHCNGLLN
jgi:hypothetical protein